MTCYMHGGPEWTNPVSYFVWIAAIGLSWAYAICYYGGM